MCLSMTVNVRDIQRKVKFCGPLSPGKTCLLSDVFGYNRRMTKEQPEKSLPPLKGIAGMRISCPDCAGRLRLTFG